MCDREVGPALESFSSGGARSEIVSEIVVRIDQMLPSLVTEPFVVPTSPAGHVAQAVLIAFAGSWIALLFHELGHALAALLVGVRIWGIRLGIGPSLWKG